MTSTRIVAAAIGLAIILPMIFLGGPVAVAIIVLFAMGVSLDEYARMAFPDDHRFAFVWLCGTSVVAYVLGVRSGVDQVLATGVALVLATFLQVTLRPGVELSGAADRVGRYVLGIAWVGMLTFLVRLRDFPHGVVWVILAMAISWLSDTGAYFAGRAFGRTPLHPRISPKKTVEGLVGGVSTAVVGALVVRALWLPELGLIDAMLLGALGSVMSVVGDLSESLLKRSFDVKDSGWILPGHGGMLDRIDSLLFVGPTVWAYMVLVRGY